MILGPFPRSGTRNTKRPEKIHSLLFCVDDRLRRGVQDGAFVVTVSPSFLYILLRPLQKNLFEFQKVVL